MKIGEVCLLTGDVPHLAQFYRALLNIDGHSDDPVHQTLIAEETMLTILHSDEPCHGQNIALAFTVDDINAAREEVFKLGALILQEPMAQPWGARNMCFADPDGRKVYFRQLPVSQAPEK